MNEAPKNKRWAACALAAVALALAAGCATQNDIRLPLRAADGEPADSVAIHNPTDDDVTVRLSYGDAGEYRITAPARQRSSHDLPPAAFRGELFVEYPSAFAGSIELTPICGIDCLVAGTLIETPDGKRAIESLRMGDLVVTPRGPQRIAATRTAKSEHLVELRFAEGIIRSSRGHDFLTDLGWRRADELSSDDRLRSGGGELLALESIRWLTPPRAVAVHSLVLEGSDAGLLIADQGLIARRAQTMRAE